MAECPTSNGTDLGSIPGTCNDILSKFHSFKRSFSQTFVLSNVRVFVLSRLLGRWVPHRGALLRAHIHNNASQDFPLKTAALPVSIGHNRFSNDFFEDFHLFFPAKRTQKRRCAVCKRVPEAQGGFFNFIKNLNLFYSRQL